MAKFLSVVTNFEIGDDQIFFGDDRLNHRSWRVSLSVMTDCKDNSQFY